MRIDFFRAAVGRSTNRARSSGALRGSISAEHGIGQLKREENMRYKSPGEMNLMRAIKRTLDPLNIMNPGKVL